MRIIFKGEQGSMLLDDMAVYKRVDKYLFDAVWFLKKEAACKAETNETIKAERELILKMASAPKFMPLSCALSSGGISYVLIRNGAAMQDAEENIKKVRAYWENIQESALEFGSDKMSVTGDGANMSLRFDIG